MSICIQLFDINVIQRLAICRSHSRDIDFLKHLIGEKNHATKDKKITSFGFN